MGSSSVAVRAPLPSCRRAAAVAVGRAGWGEGVAGDDLGGDLADAAAAGPGGLAEAVEGTRRVELLAFHENALGLLDHDPVVEGVLELADDLGGALGVGGRPEQGGDHARVGDQGLELPGLPGPVGAPD